MSLVLPQTLELNQTYKLNPDLPLIRYRGGTLNSRRAASPLMKFAEGEERWEAPDHTQGVLTQHCVETEPNHTVAGMVLKAMANNRHII
ncbi:hypothetical protein TNCV_1139221 [Trichonephila clavipes]|nr:hypothetical protein TNCV_1139221 [Trichonephila clavipes]